MNVYGIGDLHFGHRAINTYRTEFSTEEEHTQALSDHWNDTVKKPKDLVYVLGDAAFTYEGLIAIGKLRGRKILIRGNHDLLGTNAYLEFFEEVYGALSYKNKWLTHIPIHPTELYGRLNVHGHCHRVPGVPELGGELFGTAALDDRYVNLCCDWTGYRPVDLHTLQLPHRGESMTTRRSTP